MVTKRGRCHGSAICKAVCCAHTSLCKARGISVNKLAVMSDVKQSTLDNIMRGLTTNPRVKTLHKLAIAFNMTLSAFLDFEPLNNYSFEEDEP